MSVRPRHISEEEFKAMKTRVTPGGVKEHAAHGGRGGGAVAERRASGTTVEPITRTSPATIQSFFVPGPLPGANDIIRKHHMVYTRLKSQWGLTIARCIMVAKLKRVRHCHVSFTWNELHDRRDPDNVIFGQKFVLDSLRDTNIIQDDSRVFILSLTHRVLTSAGNPGVFVKIEEVEP